MIKHFCLVVFLIMNIVGRGQQEETLYFRHLRYNHVSPYVAIQGIYPLDSLTAKETTHYVFRYDKKNRLIELINHTENYEKQHPLTSFSPYRMVITYTAGKEIRTFYDKTGKRAINDKGVYKEVFFEDKYHFKNQLCFYNLNDEPMESNWGIAQYVWDKKGPLIVEKRYSLANEFVDLSPYFPFKITGILLDDKGQPIANYNLSEDYGVVNNEFGIASYQDEYDSNGNHISYTYYNSKDQIVMNEWGYAQEKKIYDANGNLLRSEKYDPEGNKIPSKDIDKLNNLVTPKTIKTLDSLQIKESVWGFQTAFSKIKHELRYVVLQNENKKSSINLDLTNPPKEVFSSIQNTIVLNAGYWYGSNGEMSEKMQNQVTILDISEEIAAASINTAEWIQYFKLKKINNQWKVINIVYQYQGEKM